MIHCISQMKDSVMATSADAPTRCPFDPALDAGRDDRKTAAIAARLAKPAHPKVIGRFALAREILRTPALKQGGLGIESVPLDDPAKAPVFFLDGEDHKKKRSTIARFFTPKSVNSHYRRVMEETSDRLLDELREKGRIQLDRATWKMAVAVAAEVVGLTESELDPMANRIEGVLGQTLVHALSPVRAFFKKLEVKVRVIHFLIKDVRPAVRARRIERRHDIISHLIDEGYSETGMLIECMTYSAAGMATTREFITMVAWHLFEREDLRSRFVNGSEADQLAMLEEILRLEPVATFLYRKTGDEVPEKFAGQLDAGQNYALDMRAANLDEAATGPCPLALDPDRASKMKEAGAYLSFGDGAHRCPGAQVALAETRIFIDRLMRIPGAYLSQPPRIEWNGALMSYELRDAIVAIR
jgi:cytochrome P450